MNEMIYQEIKRLLDWLKKYPDQSVSLCSDQIKECVEIISEKDDGND